EAALGGRGEPRTTQRYAVDGPQIFDLAARVAASGPREVQHPRRVERRGRRGGKSTGAAHAARVEPVTARVETHREPLGSGDLCPAGSGGEMEHDEYGHAETSASAERGRSLRAISAHRGRAWP